jgi:hypothetical protein
MKAPFAVCLLHEGMLNKNGKDVTTSLTLIDLHDISRSAKTYGLIQSYVAHPAILLRRLAGMLTNHWQYGYGSTYNPDRKAALDNLTVCENLEQILNDLKVKSGKPPKLIATSAKEGAGRITFAECKTILQEDQENSYLLMLGTGWGMTDQLLEKADYFLEPVRGPTPYNHLSVRSACAIILDRIFGK